MCEVFRELPEEKQMRIINAAMEVFAQNDYKKASTDDIAAKAGISKGSLFYYFKNKKSLYLYLYDYLGKMVTEQIMDEGYYKITDFFELMSYGARYKLEMLEKNPYILEFAVRSFYTEEEPVAEEMDLTNKKYIQDSFTKYFKNIDFSKFKDGIDPFKIYSMLVWMTDGYMHEKKRNRHPVDVKEIMEEFKEWAQMMKKMAYKEEYQDECN